MSAVKPTHKDFAAYAGYLVHTDGNAREIEPDEVRPSDTLVSYQCGFEPMVVAVRSCYEFDPPDIVDLSEAEDLARDYLNEINWFADGDQDADDVIPGSR